MSNTDNITGKAQAISVVIPAHNRAKTIGYCLDSVLSQSLTPLEIIVVDDCSTDNTVEVIKGYSLKSPLIRYILLEKNLGAQGARNKGINEAKGDWIAFQDSDDEWVPDKLEEQVKALSKVNFDLMTVVHSDCWRYNSVSGQKDLLSLPLVDGSNVFNQLLIAPGPVFPSILTSKKALEAIGLLDDNVLSYQEWDTAIRLAKICRFVHLREPLFTYHIHEGDTISKDRQRDIDGYQYIVDKYKDEIIHSCGRTAYQVHLVENAVRALQYGFRDVAISILQRDESWRIKSLYRLCSAGASEKSISRVWYVIQMLSRKDILMAEFKEYCVRHERTYKDYKESL